MLLESRLDENTTLLIDAEAMGGISKDDVDADFHPDDVFDHVVNTAAVVARKLAEAAARSTEAFPTPTGIDMRFGVRVDSNSVVSVSRNPSQAQFQITASWRP